MSIVPPRALRAQDAERKRQAAADAADAAAVKRAQAVAEVVAFLGGNQSAAARVLGIDQSTVNRLMKKITPGGRHTAAPTTNPEGAHPMEITLISALPGDRVPGVELSDPTCPTIPGLADREDVRAFMAAHRYGEDEDELMYLVTGDEPTPAGHPVLHLTV